MSHIHMPKSSFISPSQQQANTARAYISSHSINGLTIRPDDLRYLLGVLALPIEVAAHLLDCHAELIDRKAKRWCIPFKQLSTKVNPLPKSNPTVESPSISMGSGKLRQDSRYSKAIAHAQTYIDEHGLRNNEPTKEEYEFLYLTLGLPMDALGRLLRGKSRIHRDLTDFGIAIRSISEQKLHRYKVDFLKTWSPQMAWVLGLFYTDGYITDGKASVASIDVELLSKAGALLFKQFKIHDQLQPDGKNRILTIAIHHPEMLADLRSLGLEDRKSLTMKFPNVPDDYIRHFIRGCWDGDGGFTVSNGKLTAHYTCGSLPFIQRLADELFKAGVSRRLLHIDKTQSYPDAIAQYRQFRQTYGNRGPFPLRIYKRRDANAYDIRLAGKAQLAPLFEYLYQSVPESIYLRRKYELIYTNLQSGANPDGNILESNPRT